MSKKSATISALIEKHRGQKLDPHYLCYFELFNAQLFYESHDVLEELWLVDRKRANGDFYKGLIQLSGAFVHLQKNRLHPSSALFKLAKNNLEKYPFQHEKLDLQALVVTIDNWITQVEENNFAQNPLDKNLPPKIALMA